MEVNALTGSRRIWMKNWFRLKEIFTIFDLDKQAHNHLWSFSSFWQTTKHHRKSLETAAVVFSHATRRVAIITEQTDKCIK